MGCSPDVRSHASSGELSVELWAGEGSVLARLYPQIFAVCGWIKDSYTPWTLGKDLYYLTVGSIRVSVKSDVLLDCYEPWEYGMSNTTTRALGRRYSCQNQVWVQAMGCLRVITRMACIFYMDMLLGVLWVAHMITEWDGPRQRSCLGRPIL